LKGEVFVVGPDVAATPLTRNDHQRTVVVSTTWRVV